MISKELNAEAVAYMTNRILDSQYLKEIPMEDRMDIMVFIVDSIALYVEGCNISAISHNFSKYKH